MYCLWEFMTPLMINWNGHFPTPMAIDETLRNSTNESTARKTLRDLERSGVFPSVPYKKRCTLRVAVDGKHAYIAGESYLLQREQSILNYYESADKAEAGAPWIIETIDDGTESIFRTNDGRHYHLFVETPLPVRRARLLRKQGVDIRYTPKVTLDDEMDD